MAQYDEFSNIYDALMDEVDYESWTEFIIKLFEKSGVTPKNILDVACGTGNISIPLSKAGYNVCGVDISENMLSIAENKARTHRQNIKFIKQDIRELNINSTFDAIICACDGINYILKDEDLYKTFYGLYRVLKDDGIFIFDISSYYKLKYILNNNTFFDEKQGICYCWENEYDDNTSIITMRLNFFVPEGELYYRFEEVHQQRAYKSEMILEKLNECGFCGIETYDDFNFKEPDMKSERTFFLAKKLGKQDDCGGIYDRYIVKRYK